MPRPIALHLSIPALQHNLQQVKRQLKAQTDALGRATPLIWAVIKANAYGHGIENAVQGFQQADGLAMLDFSEAQKCRDLGWTKPIMLLEGVFEAADLHLADELGLTLVVHNELQIQLLEQYQPQYGSFSIMTKLNTGMNRLGFSAEQFKAAFQRLTLLKKKGVIGELGKMTHFARADDDERTTQQQIQCFNQVTQDLCGSISLCNSAGTLSDNIQKQLMPDYQQWVRPGVCLYGASPFAHRSAKQMGLQPAQTLKAEIISIRDIPAQQGVGYGHGFVSTIPMRIGVVSCGYADGYPRHASSGTPIVVGGQRTQVVGRVSMDMLMVDLTHLPLVEVGAEVVLWGENGPCVDEVAQASGTIGYELLCAVAARVPRIITK